MEVDEEGQRKTRSRPRMRRRMADRFTVTDRVLRGHWSVLAVV